MAAELETLGWELVAGSLDEEGYVDSSDGLAARFDFMGLTLRQSQDSPAVTGFNSSVATVGGVEIDDSYLYMVDRGNRALRRMDIHTFQVDTLASWVADDLPTSFRLSDDMSVGYVSVVTHTIVGNDWVDTDSRIYSVDLTSGALTLQHTFADTNYCVSDLDVDTAGNFYTCGKSQLSAIIKKGDSNIKSQGLEITRYPDSVCLLPGEATLMFRYPVSGGQNDWLGDTSTLANDGGTIGTIAYTGGDGRQWHWRDRNNPDEIWWMAYEDLSSKSVYKWEGVADNGYLTDPTYTEARRLNIASPTPNSLSRSYILPSPDGETLFGVCQGGTSSCVIELKGGWGIDVVAM